MFEDGRRVTKDREISIEPSLEAMRDLLKADGLDIKVLVAILGHHFRISIILIRKFKHVNY